MLSIHEEFDMGERVGIENEKRQKQHMWEMEKLTQLKSFTSICIQHQTESQ